MNIPNKLTTLRLFLIIPIVFFFSLSYKGGKLGILFSAFAFLCYLAAVFTDYLDGKIAREEKIITDFGKLMDPLADKMLVFSILLVVIKNDNISLWLVLILLFREFIITGIRMLVIQKNGDVIAASNLGKIKTVAQFAAITLMFFIPVGDYTKMINSFLILPSVLFSLASAYEYYMGSKKYISNEK